MKKSYIAFFILWGSISMPAYAALPDGFVYLKDVNPHIVQDMRYATDNNFMGRPVKGYEAPTCILTKPAAMALSNVQKLLESQHLSLKVHDCYRPQMAVDDFVAWSVDPSDQKMKASYYPNIDKKDLFSLGYIARKSGHTRGSTVDLTIVTAKGEAIDMGTTYDFMDPASHNDNTNLNPAAYKNRMILKEAMEASGFDPYLKEWWHFTLKNEPYPNTYFNFPVQISSK